MMDKILEDKNLCKACGGRCCKKSGCDYSTSDFESIKREVILGALETGEVSVVATFDFKRRSNGRLVSIPFLYLRARNKERDVIDLLSIKTGCSMLTDEGCIYNFQNRPTGGVNLMVNVILIKVLWRLLKRGDLIKSYLDKWLKDSLGIVLIKKLDLILCSY